MKPEPTYQKLRGGYYTPEIIADFVANWAIQSLNSDILEPSCGDGAIIRSAVARLAALGATGGEIALRIHGVEIDPREAQKTSELLKDISDNGLRIDVSTRDFFSYCVEKLFDESFFGKPLAARGSFDVVIGNPPFIRYQNFPEEYKQKAIEIARAAGLKPSRLTNSWLLFLVASSLMLRARGRLAMVIPAELFQVNYAAEARNLLSKFFEEITIVTFKRLVFKGVQQEIMVFLGERNNSGNPHIRVVELDSIEDLATYDINKANSSEFKPLCSSADKWTIYFLNSDEMALIQSLRNNSGLTTSSDVIDVDVGVVTGENKFFILDKEKMEKYHVEAFCERIVTRSNHLAGVILSESDFINNVERGLKTFLLNVPATPLTELPSNVTNYIEEGEKAGVYKGYKCRMRRWWYSVPSTWIPDAFMLRQVHSYPKLVLNHASATSTDTVHRVKFKKNADCNAIAVSLLNSLTFAFAELTGRSYGGGVLTFEPSEAENLPLPLTGAESLDINLVNKLINSKQINRVLDITDEVLLEGGLGLAPHRVEMLRGIWEKLRDRRQKRKYSF
jgi:adenine-specific DNA-methyltransferase